MKFITVTPYRHVFANGQFGWSKDSPVILNTRYIVSITIMSEKLSQVQMKDGSCYIVPTPQITGVAE